MGGEERGREVRRGGRRREEKRGMEGEQEEKEDNGTCIMEGHVSRQPRIMYFWICLGKFHVSMSDALVSSLFTASPISLVLLFGGCRVFGAVV